jgi:hypothetical protein
LAKQKFFNRGFSPICTDSNMLAGQRMGQRFALHLFSSGALEERFHLAEWNCLIDLCALPRHQKKKGGRRLPCVGITETESVSIRENPRFNIL